jgi:HD-GYP domain-containing protein (c-di-GMP phosphodiesterase class II)
MAEFDFHEGLSRVIAQLTAAVTNTSLYSATHPQVAAYIDKAYRVLTDLLRIKPEITILLIGEDLVADNKPLPSGNAYIDNFVRILKKKAIERMTFVSGLPPTELQGLIHDLASPDAVAVRSSACIKLGKVELRVKKGDSVKESPSEVSPDAPQEDIKSLLALTATELDELKDLYLRIKKHKQIDVRGVDDVVKGFIAGFRKEINPLGILASLKSAHEYTFTHVTNVGILTISQAETLGFTGEHLHQVGVASLLHDVGKLFIPEEILSKPSALTTDERKIIETHTVKGARYLMGLEGIPKLAVLAAMEHHLKYDGTGYPSIKGGWRPNIVSQMISISDVFDAMRSRRSYQEPKPLEKIVEILQKGSGVSFNPQLVQHFLKLIKQR